MSFTFIDLFAGIGGMRQGFERIGGKCIFTSEIDNYAQQTYIANYGSENMYGDITKITSDNIPLHDVLLAGFPCQPFSLAGRKLGFEDARGTLFFEIARILKDKKPKAFLLENVKNLMSHDKGKTFNVIKTTLEELGYNIHYKIIDASNFIPQHRERIYIVGFRNDIKTNFEFKPIITSTIKIFDLFHKADGTEPYLEHDGNRFFNHQLKQVDDKFTHSDALWDWTKSHKEKHQSKGNGFGYGLITEDSIRTCTLTAHYNKSGNEILIEQANKNPRKLTPRECARLMGFSDDFKIPVSNTRAYIQFGNSVVVPVIGYIANSMKEYLM